MGISDFDPSLLTPAEAKGIANDLVNMNIDALSQFGNMLISPSIDRVLANEAAYEQIYKPVMKGVKSEVKTNTNFLEKMQRDIIALGLSEVQSNQGKVLNLTKDLKGTLDAQSIPVNGGISGASVNGTGSSGGVSSSGTITTTNGDAVSAGMSNLPPDTTTTSTDSGTTPTVSPLPVDQSTQTTISPIQGTSQTTSGTSQTIGSIKIAPPIGNPDVIPTNLCGPPAINYVPPDCPVGYHANYNVATECWECIKDAIQPQPITECPIGYIVQTDPVTGAIQCIKPPDCPILPPPPKPPPPPSPIATCPKPTNIPCPEGYDYWWNPDEGGWQCTPNGVKPTPAPQPVPVVPNCQELMDRMQLSLNVNCNDLPDTMQKRLKECGYKMCEQSIKQAEENLPDNKGEFQFMINQLFLALSIFGWVP